MSFLIFIFAIILIVFISFNFIKKNDSFDQEVYNDHLSGDYNLVLIDAGIKRPQVLNLLRKYTKKSKEKCEKMMLNTPSVILYHIDYNEARIIMSHFEKYNAVLEIKQDMMP